MLGTSFDHHVTAGYQFLMRYYVPGDKIYIFGFSRGAYTARFLTEMIHKIGLLSMGNEEMVRFAMSTFSDYQRLSGDMNKKNEATRAEKETYMTNFNQTFCRAQVLVHFLGLFDCVNSVAQYEVMRGGHSTPFIPEAPAKHIRHALSIHERRLKFRPALFLITPSSKPDACETIKEEWFAGNHGDVGGGWSLEGQAKEVPSLLSDIALEWMVQEVRAVDEIDPVS